MRNTICLPLLAAAMFYLPSLSRAQSKELRLACLLNNAVEHPVMQGGDASQQELKIVLSSTTDTLVKMPADGVISTIQRNEEGKWDLVFFQNDYWFWLAGLSKVTVGKGQKIKTGEAIGVLNAGQKIELLLFAFESPLDPKKYMNCHP